jgi:beta-galactosidase
MPETQLAPRVRLVPGGLDLDGTLVPLYAGSVHYWRLERASWKACLQAVKAIGFRVVDLYVPWAVHERAVGDYDFGEHDPRLDVSRFLDLIAELGMYAIVRPGPHINAELTHFGIPSRIIWNRACQARSPRDNPVMLPMVPAAFPVPSYASEVFHEETARYFRALGPHLAKHLWPRGPIVLLQVDNEGALNFRDGAYDQDYHPDAIAIYRQFLREKYGTEEALAATYGIGPTLFAEIDPPRRFDATKADELTRHLDWVECHEHLLANAMKRFAKALVDAGLEGVPTTHNLPFGQETTPLNPARLGEAVDLVALDYYHKASPLDREVIARRTTELAARCEGKKQPAFAAEMGAGFPPFFPPLDENDSIFTLLTALAYGLRGFNLYMAVTRDRWIGGPVDPRGKRRPSARAYEKLCAGLERVAFSSLTRRTPVRLVTPRSLRRLTRVMHAFGPATGALFAVLGAGARERCFEDDLGLGGPIAIEGDELIRAFEQALEARGVPFAHVGGEDADVALDGASWVICATNGGMKPALFQRLARLAKAGTLVTIGPRPPTRDGSFRPVKEPFDLASLAVVSSSPLADKATPADADRLVARAIETLALPTFAADPDHVHVAVHETAGGVPRVAFVINAGLSDVVARVTIPGAKGAADLFDGTKVRVDDGVLVVRTPPKTVRILELSA